MKILIVNVAWIDNGWQAISNQTKSGHKHVQNGGIAHESVNFKFDGMWNKENLYGYCQFTNQPSAKGNDNIVVFYSDKKIVGIYTDVEFGKFTPLNKPNEIEFFNMKANKNLSFKVENYLSFDKNKYLPENKERIGQTGFTYIKKEHLLNILNDIISLNADLYNKIEKIVLEKNIIKDKQMNNIWIIAPGEEALIWDDCKNNDYIAIGWDKININNYSNIEDLKKDLISFYQLDNSTRKHNYLWNFGKNIKKGDLIIARNGKTKIIGIGKVVSDYISPNDDKNPRINKEYKQIRRVKWIDTSEYNLENGEFAIQTVAKVSENDKRIKDYLKWIIKKEKLTTKINILKHQKQIILQGPPGTGKTRLAKQMARMIIKNDDTPNIDDIKDQVKLIQFHPSYSYEDFVRGIVAKANGTQIEYKAEDKILAQMAKEALDNPEKEYILIIDEINRANLSSVLGELIYALEYRDEAVESMYEVDNSKEIILPSNLYIIGTMNTADRSIGHIDYAIRRRFAFENILPNEDIVNPNSKFNEVKKIFEKHLSPEFDKEKDKVMLGHSYFIADNEEQLEEELENKLKYQVIPLLKEYVKDGVLNESALSEIDKLGN